MVAWAHICFSALSERILGEILDAFSRSCRGIRREQTGFWDCMFKKPIYAPKPLNAIILINPPLSLNCAQSVVINEVFARLANPLRLAAFD